MKLNSIYQTAEMGRKSAITTLLYRKLSGEDVGRVHTLPALAASDVEALFEAALFNTIQKLQAA